MLERGFTAATQLLRVPRAPLGLDCARTNSLEGDLHTEMAKHVGSGARVRCAVGRPSQRAPPHHCGCSKDYCGLERTVSYLDLDASRTEGIESPRQPNRSIEESSSHCVTQQLVDLTLLSVEVGLRRPSGFDA